MMRMNPSKSVLLPTKPGGEPINPNPPPNVAPSAKAANQPPQPTSSNNNREWKPMDVNNNNNQGKDKPPEDLPPPPPPKQKEPKKPKEEAKGKKKKCCRAGVCRCWYCCGMHCLLCPLLWLFGVALFGLSLYYGLKYTLEVDGKEQEKNLLFMYWGTLAYALLFVIMVQMTYCLVLFESTNRCGRILMAILFIFMFLFCLVVLIFTIFCREWCLFGSTESFPVLRDHHWRARIPTQIFHLLLAAAITLGLLIILLHIYLYNTLQFVEEKALRENKEKYCDCGNPTDTITPVLNPVNKVVAVRAPTKNPTMITKYHTESELNNSSSYNPTFASIAQRYRSISYERSTPPTYVINSDNAHWV